MPHINGTAPAPEKKEYRTCGPLAWEETEGGVRIVKLTEASSSVIVPREIGGLPVVELGQACFCGTEQMEKITLPDTLKKIGCMAFSGCHGLEELTIPDSVEELGHHMLMDSGVTALKLPKALKELPASVFSYCKGLRRVELNEGLHSIGAHAFYNTRVGEYEPLVLPDSVQEIAPGAFYTPIGTIKIKTALPVDPFWFSDLPAPFAPAQKGQPSMITPATRGAVSKLLRDAVGQLAQKAAQTRWTYQRGLMTQTETRSCAGGFYYTTIRKLEDDIRMLCRENELTWNEAEFRCLNEVLLMSCGMGYHLNKAGGITVGLLEDVEGDPDLMGRMHRLVLGEH